MSRFEILSAVLFLLFYNPAHSLSDTIDVTATGVGINEANPVYDLEVDGNAYATGQIGAYSSTASSYLFNNGLSFTGAGVNTRIDQNGAGSNIQLRTKDSGGLLRSRITVWGTNASGRVDVDYGLKVTGGLDVYNGLDVSGGIVMDVIPATGNYSYLCHTTGGEIGWCSSSMRYKSNIQDFNIGLDFLRKLRPVSYNWKSDESAGVGLVAEEVAKIDERFVTRGKSSEIQGVRYAELVVVLRNAIMEQQKAIDKLRKDLEKFASKAESCE